MSDQFEPVSREVYERAIAQMLERLAQIEAAAAEAEASAQRRYAEDVARQKSNRDNGLVLGIASGLMNAVVTNAGNWSALTNDRSAAVFGVLTNDRSLRNYIEIARRLVDLSNEGGGK